MFQVNELLSPEPASHCHSDAKTLSLASVAAPSSKFHAAPLAIKGCGVGIALPLLAAALGDGAGGGEGLVLVVV